MATIYTQQAESQLNPLYQQQTDSLNAQLPAIQQMYATLMGGLDASYTQNMNTGISGINEDAASRGVSRSTLPNDARQMLTSTLGSELMKGKSQLGFQQAQEVSGVNERLAQVGLSRVNAINDLSRSLETSDLEKQKFEYQKQLDAQNLELEKQKLAASRSSQAANAKVVDYAGNLVSDMSTWFKTKGSMPSRQEQDAFVDNWMNRQGVTGSGNRQVFWDAVNSYFGRVNDPTKDWTWR